MLKRDEVTSSASCLNKAKDDEMIFVLLGRDRAAPAAIEAWIRERIRLGLNEYEDTQIFCAEECVEEMRNSQKKAMVKVNQNGGPGNSTTMRKEDWVVPRPVPSDELIHLFRAASDCYADTADGAVVMAMTEERFLEVVKKLRGDGSSAGGGAVYAS